MSSILIAAEKVELLLKAQYPPPAVTQLGLVLSEQLL